MRTVAIALEIWGTRIIYNSATSKMLQSQIIKLVAEEARIDWISLYNKIQRPGARLGTEVRYCT